MSSVSLGNLGLVESLPPTSFKNTLHEKVFVIAVFNKHMPALELDKKRELLSNKISSVQRSEIMNGPLGFFLEGAALCSVVGLGVLFGTGAGTTMVLVAMVGAAAVGAMVRSSAASSLLPGAFLGALGPLIGRALPVALVVSEAGLQLMMSCTLIGGIAFCALRSFSWQKELSSAKKDIETAKEDLYAVIAANKLQLATKIQESIEASSDLLKQIEQRLKSPLGEVSGESPANLRLVESKLFFQIEGELHSAKTAVELLAQFS